MPFNISNFSSIINKTGILKNNKFDVQIVYPDILKDNNNLFQELMFRAQSVIVPGVSIETQPINRYGIGVKEKFANRAYYEDTISITFIERNDSSIRDLMTKWINLIVNFHNVRSFSEAPTYLTRYKNTYIAEMIINHYSDNEDKISNVYHIHEVFPISLSPIPLGWSENNDATRVQVEFAFTEWYSLNLQKANLQNAITVTPPQAGTVTPPQVGTVQNE